MSQVMVLALLVMFLAAALVGIALLAVSGPGVTQADGDLVPVAEPPTDPVEVRPA